MTLLFKLLYRLYRIVSWARYVLPRRFTRAGLTVLGALVVAGTAASAAAAAPAKQSIAVQQVVSIGSSFHDCPPNAAAPSRSGR